MYLWFVKLSNNQKNVSDAVQFCKCKWILLIHSPCNVVVLLCVISIFIQKKKILHEFIYDILAKYLCLKLAGMSGVKMKNYMLFKKQYLKKWVSIHSPGREFSSAISKINCSASRDGFPSVTMNGEFLIIS